MSPSPLQIVSDRATQIPPQPEDDEAAGPACAQNAHKQPALLTPYRLRIILATIGWSERELARRSDNHPTQIRRWLESGLTDAGVIGRLLALEQCHRDNAFIIPSRLGACARQFARMGAGRRAGGPHTRDSLHN